MRSVLACFPHFSPLLDVEWDEKNQPSHVANTYHFFLLFFFFESLMSEILFLQQFYSIVHGWDCVMSGEGWETALKRPRPRVCLLLISCHVCLLFLFLGNLWQLKIFLAWHFSVFHDFLNKQWGKWGFSFISFLLHILQFPWTIYCVR